MFVHVPPLRNFFLIPSNYSNFNSNFLSSLGELVRKIWNPQNFKSHVDPHELLQSVSISSNKKFRIGNYSDAINFLTWFLTYIHKSLGGTKLRLTSVIHRAFSGEVLVETLKETDSDVNDNSLKITRMSHPFLFLSLDLPAKHLFKDNQLNNIIPQVPLQELLCKYNGINEIFKSEGEKNRFSLLRLPRYLIIHLKRFTSNQFSKEKNHTIVNFPIKNLSLKDFITAPHRELLEKLTIEELKRELRYSTGIKVLQKFNSIEDEKKYLIEQLQIALHPENVNCKYDLIANICHNGEADSGQYLIHVFSHANNQWYSFEDLYVKEILPQLVAVSESYIQCYELQNPLKNTNKNL